MHPRSAGPTWSRLLRREHRRLGTEWARAAAEPGRERLTNLGRQLTAHLAEEERHVHPLVRQHLPPGTGTLDAVREEHATFLSLLELLDRRLTGRVHDTDPSVVVIVHDIEQLWRAHVRRFDRVIGPVLKHLDAGKDSA